MHHAKVSQGIYVLEFITVVLILQSPIETCTEPSKVSDMDVFREIVHNSENTSAKSPTSDALVAS